MGVVFRRFWPSRGMVKLLYVFFLWCGLCYLAFRFKWLQSSVYQPTRVLLEADTRSGTPGIPQNYLDLVPQVDNSAKNNDQDTATLLSQRTNLPTEYLAKKKKPRPPYNKTCGFFPNLYELEFNNLYWQHLTSSNGSFFLYGAYYDNRWRAGKPHLIRILGMVDRIQPPPMLCLFWFENIKALVSKVTYTYAWYSKWGNYKNGILQPFVMSCRIPTNLVPTSVSLVEKPCDKPTNNLRVINNQPKKKDTFAVCVKGLDFLHDDLSVRLVEWLELLEILGAKKVFLYELDIHPNISKVLRYYQKRGLVELTPITLPGNMPNLPGFRHLFLKKMLNHKRQNELIPYNDCLYRNLYSYKYIALLDIDEVIMPLQHSTWDELMEEVERLSLAERNYTRASYNFRNVYFLDDLQDGEELQHTIHEQGIPPYLHMLQHVYRSKNYTKPGSYVKSFHNPDRVVSLHNHFPLNCLGTCTTYSVNTSLAHLQHYRKDCVGTLKNSCKTDFRIHTVRDTSIWRFKDELIKRTTEVLTKLDFFPHLS